MAEFFPPVPDEVWPEGAERPSNEPELLFRRQLEAALADRPWLVIQNLLVQAPDRVGTREIDFLVIDPARGMVVIEVKGGDYRFSPVDGWHRVVRGEVRPDGPGAPRQAIGAMYALVQALATHALHNARRPPYLHGWLVALPDAEIDATTLPPDAVGHVLDARRCHAPARLLADIEDLLASLALHYPDVACGEDSCVPALVERHMLPWTRARLSVRDEIRSARVVETDVLRPIRTIMDACLGIDRLSVRGYPGTGKTYAALCRARADLAAGRRTLVLCFNVPLAASLTARLHALPVRPTTTAAEIAARQVVVARIHALAEAATAALDRRGALPDPSHGQAYFDALLTALPEAAERGLFGAFDSIVVDEGQDFSPTMLDAVDALAGRCARIAFFHDPNQTLYGGTSAADLERRFGQPLVLRENLRNSPTITDFLRSLDPTRLQDLDSPPSLRNGQPVVVWEHEADDPAAQLAAITRIVRHLRISEDVRTDDIVLLSPFRADRGVLAGVEAIDGLPVVSIEESVRLEPGTPCLRRETLHRFKGLEAPAVILHDVRGAAENVSYEAILTGASRARNALYILRSGDYAGGAALPVQGELP
jgi:hypothetical protein